MDIQTIQKIDNKSTKTMTFTRLVVAILFIFLVFIWSYTHYGSSTNIFLFIGAIFGAYMAMNIGANDVANNVGPAVGSKALTMFGAVVIAAVFETAGTFLAGADVVNTIKNGIIDPSLIPNPEIFIWAMAAALLAAAIWLNFSTFVGTPVSTTHSIVGGVLGAGIAAAGFDIVSWMSVGKIVLSWIISPILGGVFAAGFLYFIKRNIVYKKDMLGAAKTFVPLLISIMTWAFVTYLILKGLKHLIHLSTTTTIIISLIIGVLTYFVVKPLVAKKALSLENSRESINTLFNIPLIFSAALLSFAHGANDSANAIGPLAAIASSVIHSNMSSNVGIPYWVMGIGGLGISIGLLLYGPKLIRTVGSEITELDQIRAFSIAIASAVVVILASGLGLPVSSTHIAVGGVFGVGFLREWLYSSESNFMREAKHKLTKRKKELNIYNAELKKLDAKEKKDKVTYRRIIELFNLIEKAESKAKSWKKEFKSAKKVKYVKREAVNKIVAAWVITVPAAALIGAGVFYMIKGIML